MTIPVPPAIPPYIPPYGPTPNITPFTYRDGQTYLQILDGLRKYITSTLVPWIETNYGKLSEAWAEEVQKIIDAVNEAIGDLDGKSVEEAIDELIAYVDNILAQVINDSIEVQDPVVAGLVRDPDSLTSNALSEVIVEPYMRRSGAAISATMGHEYPVAVNPIDYPIFSYSTAVNPLNGIYWPTFIDLSLRGGIGVALMFSSDHAGNAYSGFGLATAPSPLGPFTYHGKVWRDDTDTAYQTETPSFIGLDKDTGDWLFSYQLFDPDGSYALESGFIARCTSPDLRSGWSRVGKMSDTDPFNAVSAAEGHTGYAVPWSSGGQYYAISLLSGSTSGTFFASRRLMTSFDGKTWAVDQRPLWQWPALIDDIEDYNADEKWGMARMNASAPFRWQGDWWLIATANKAISGATITPRRLLAVKLSDDYRRPLTRPIDITPPLQSWMDQDNLITDVGTVFNWDNRLFMPFRAGDRLGSFGVLEIV